MTTNIETAEIIEAKKEEEKLPEELEREIDETRLKTEKKLDAVDKADIKSILKLSDEREIIKKIRELPVLTQEDHKILDQLDKSKFRLWMMRESQKDEWEIRTKIPKSKNEASEEFEYELEKDTKIPKLDKLLAFYSPLTNNQKKTLRRLESIATNSAISYNQKNLDCLSMSTQGKTDTKEYWDAVKERERLQSIYEANSEAASKKNAEFRLGIKPSEFDHLIDQDLMRYLAVALYKESTKNP